MPQYREYETSLRAATLAFVAGAHFISRRFVEEHSHLLTDLEIETLAERLQISLRRTRRHANSAELLSHLLNEEALFPFEDQWDASDLARLLYHVKTPLILEDSAFKMIQGFRKNLLTMAREAALANDEESNYTKNSVDHWLVLIVNLSFFAGALALARVASQTEAFPYGPQGRQLLPKLTSQWALDLLEEEPQQAEVWSQYAQLNDLVEDTITIEGEQQKLERRDEEDDEESGDYDERISPAVSNDLMEFGESDDDDGPYHA